uniref:Fe2OG dioxygenase domain-containing protein n=1 Tax=Heliothis virescens TaxID=7102 RepID=A0A2A4JNU8_HELVI
MNAIAFNLEDYKVITAPETAYYISEFISPEEEKGILTNIYAAPKPKWTQLSNRRLQNWGGIPHNNGMIAETIPPWLDKYLEKIHGLNVMEGKRPNHVLVNEYLPGQGIMPHLDGSLFYPTITTISVGSHIVLNFLEPTEDNTINTDPVFSFLLEPRSLLILQDKLYTQYLHCIEELKEDLLDESIVNINMCSDKLRNELVLGKAFALTDILPEYSAVAITSLGPKDACYNEMESLDEARENIRWGVGAGVKLLKRRGCTAIDVDPATEPDAAAEAAELAAWKFECFKSMGTSKRRIAVNAYGAEGKELWHEGAVRGRAQNWARFLYRGAARNAPPVLIAAKGYRHTFLTVSRGSCAPPVLLDCSYRGAARNAPPVLIAAKGYRHTFLTVSRGSCAPPVLLDCSYRGAARNAPPVLIAAKGYRHTFLTVSRGSCAPPVLLDCSYRGAARNAPPVLIAAKGYRHTFLTVSRGSCAPPVLLDCSYRGAARNAPPVLIAAKGYRHTFLTVSRGSCAPPVLLDCSYRGAARNAPPVLIAAKGYRHTFLTVSRGSCAPPVLLDCSYRGAARNAPPVLIAAKGYRHTFLTVSRGSCAPPVLLDCSYRGAARNAPPVLIAAKGYRHTFLTVSRGSCAPPVLLDCSYRGAARNAPPVLIAAKGYRHTFLTVSRGSCAPPVLLDCSYRGAARNAPPVLIAAKGYRHTFLTVSRGSCAPPVLLDCSYRGAARNAPPVLIAAKGYRHTFLTVSRGSCAPPVLLDCSYRGAARNAPPVLIAAKGYRHTFLTVSRGSCAPPVLLDCSYRGAARNAPPVLIAAKGYRHTFLTVSRGSCAPPVLLDCSYRGAARNAPPVLIAAKGYRHTFLTVSRGSCAPPVLLDCSYRGAARNAPPVLIAAKGVTFDRCVPVQAHVPDGVARVVPRRSIDRNSHGGLCLKQCEAMIDNRGSMAGAAVALAALKTVAMLKLPINISLVIPICENMVSGQCMKVGDVVQALNGMSIQIENTDMEGRLMMADALVYGQSIYKPSLVIDVATFTHGVLMATGGGAFGCFSNSAAAWQATRAAGARAGDRPWRFPLWQYYNKHITNDPSVDLRNKGSGHATPCLGAAFLKNFICSDWVHMDITGVGKVAHVGAPPYLSPRRMTGRPARTLAALLQDVAGARDHKEHTEAGCAVNA